jgi:RNase P protein component
VPREYAAVFAERRVLRGSSFDLLRGALPAGADVVGGGTGRHSRLGLIIPKRLVRRAVMRNAIKRQAREAFRHLSDDLPAADIVLRLARWPQDIAALAATPPRLKRALRAEIEQLLRRLADTARRASGIPAAAAP